MINLVVHSSILKRKNSFYYYHFLSPNDIFSSMKFYHCAMQFNS